MNDQQFDRLLKASLSWQADRAIAQQPMRLAMRRLAVRLGPGSPSLRPRFVPEVAPATASMSQLILLAALLLALIVGAIVAGAWLLDRRGHDIRPFGFADDCGSQLSPATELEASVDGGPTTRLYADGVLVTDLSVAAGTRTGTLHLARFEEHRLTQRGTELLLDRLGEAGLSPGCRTLRSQQSTGLISARTAQGYRLVYWGPDASEYRPVRVIDASEEQELITLAGELRNPSTWLPADAFVEPGPRTVELDRWLLTVGFFPTGLPPGAGLNLPNGLELRGHDPRYALVVLPDGADLSTIGEERPKPPPHPDDNSVRGTVRCASLHVAEAVALTESLDRLTLGALDEGDLLNEDLSMEVTIGLRPVVPASYDCAALWAESNLEPMPTPSLTPQGDLASVDPCTLVPDGEPILHALGVQRLVVRTAFVGPVAGHSCGLFDTSGTMGETIGAHGHWRADLSLFPSRVSREQALELALDLLGKGANEQVAGERVTWADDCASSEQRCAGVIAGWTEGHLVVFKYVARRGPAGQSVPAGAALSFVEAALTIVESR